MVRQKSKGIDMNIIITTLKKKFFELALVENFPNTPDITEQLDQLQKRIKKELAKMPRANS